MDGATTPSFNKANPFKLTLNPGWNQIGNPYTFDLVWSEVLTANSNPAGIGTLKKFKGSYVDEPDLKVFEGAFVVNTGSAPVTLDIPVTGSQSGGRFTEPNYDLAAEDWVVPLRLKVGQFENNLGGVGMHPQATSSIDGFDDFTPPALTEDAQLVFAHPEHFLKRSSRDVVKTQAEFKWQFSVDTKLEETATIFWNNDLFGNNEFEIYLIDLRLMKVMDMRTQSSYTFDPRTSGLFEIHFGKGIGNKVRPQQVLLGKAYPNPSAGMVNIPFALPEFSETHQVTLEVYDLTGRKLNTLLDKPMQGGYYQAEWESNLSPVVSGFYIYRLSVSGRDRNEVLYDKIMIKQ